MGRARALGMDLNTTFWGDLAYFRRVDYVIHYKVPENGERRPLPALLALRRCTSR